MRNIHETIDKLRDAPNHEIDLPKGVAVGLLVGIEDALSKLRHVKTMVKTKKYQRECASAIFDLEGPRDRLLRVVTGEAR